MVLPSRNRTLGSAWRQLPLLIGSQDQALLSGHVVRLGAAVASQPLGPGGRRHRTDAALDQHSQPPHGRPAAGAAAGSAAAGWGGVAAGGTTRRSGHPPTTDSLDEQAWLEDFLEASKPELPGVEECAVRHRLLLTPFRYRQRHGSRFATRWERGLFYGSRSRFGCLLEGAYYELVFNCRPSCVILWTATSARAWAEKCAKLESRPLNTTRRVALRM